MSGRCFMVGGPLDGQWRDDVNGRVHYVALPMRVRVVAGGTGWGPDDDRRGIYIVKRFGFAIGQHDGETLRVGIFDEDYPTTEREEGIRVWRALLQRDVAKELFG